ncbi:MAG TPA: tetratricopeptide repeat protein [Streptosporangiaceae bacterium]|nr:tetratricopeptide repeat protein [Streptosporangiaceae bacterium]
MAGRFETALSLAEEHVRLRRPAMSNTATPEQRFHYARALAQIGRNLHLLDRHHEAAATLEKAITIIRESGREQWLPSLAEYLRLRSRCLRIIGRAEEALASAEEVVTLETQLRLDDPVGDPSHLARALEDLAYCLSKLERYSDAASASREAVSLRRQPTANESTDARYDLARTLGQYSFNAERAGQLSAAIAANEEEVALRRSLPLRDVTSDASDLAWALHNLAFLLEDAGRFAEALPIAEEAINRYQRLQQAGLLGSDGEHEFTLATKTLGRLRQTPQGGQEGIDSQFFAGHWQEEMDDGSVLEWSLRLNGSFAARFVSINPSYRLIVKRWYGEWQVSLDDPLDQWIELVATDIDSGVLLGFFGALAGRSEAPKETLDRLTRSANIINFIERGFTLSWTGYSGTERYTSTWKML